MKPIKKIKKESIKFKNSGKAEIYHRRCKEASYINSLITEALYVYVD